MKYYIIIPAHNEALYLGHTLRSLADQTLLPQKVIVVNDHSTDGTEGVIDDFASNYPYILKRNATSAAEHLPGSKVIDAFNKGLDLVDRDFDFIVKLDADLILPPIYFEKIAEIFRRFPTVGIAGGFIYEADAKGDWILNHPMDKSHVRGAFKAYTKTCFTAIGGLQSAMGWDTVDELLAQYHSFTTYTDPSLHIKHLRPVGRAYGKKARLLQGQAMYTMRYGLAISLIASAKMALNHKKPQVFWDNLQGYLKARAKNLPFLVTPEEGQFIRDLRWKNIKAKLF